MTTAAADFLAEVLARPLGQAMPSVVVVPRARRARQKAVDFPATPAGRKLARKHTARKGRMRQLLARDYFKARGYQVEITYGKVLWIPGPTGKRIPITKRHDLFGLWDLIVVGHGQRFFVQVGGLDDVSTKRRAILEAKWPATEHDLILGHEGGRRFRVLRGPAFETGKDVIEVPR